MTPTNHFHKRTNLVTVRNFVKRLLDTPPQKTVEEYRRLSVEMAGRRRE